MKKRKLSVVEDIYEMRFIRTCYKELSKTDFKCVFSSTKDKECDYIYTRGWHLSGLRKHLYTKAHKSDFDNEFEKFVQLQREKCNSLPGLVKKTAPKIKQLLYPARNGSTKQLRIEKQFYTWF